MSIHINSQENHLLPAIPKDRRWFLIGISALIIIILAVGGIWFYEFQSQVIKTQKKAELNTIAELKINQIVQWRLERLSDARIFSSGALTSSAINQWITHPDDLGTRDLVTGEMAQLLQVYGYKNVILATTDGQVLLTLDPKSTTLDPETQQLVKQASAASQPIMGDFFMSQSAGRIYIEVAAAITGGDNQSPTIIILRIDPEQYLFPLIQTWPTNSPSAETLVVRKDGENALFLNSLRHSDSPPLSIRIPLSSTEVPAVQAILGASGSVEGSDYRGNLVLADVHPIPGSDWFMVTKVDAQEILSGVQLLGWIIVLVIGLSIIMTAAVAAYLFLNSQRRFYKTQYLAGLEQNKTQQEIRTALYSIGDGVITTDEIGIITRMNPVAENLTGWVEAEALDRPLEDVFNIVSEITLHKVENPVKRILSEGAIVGLANHTLLINRSGETHPIADSGAPIRDASGHILGVVLVFRDQTAERAYQSERALLTDTLSASLNEIYIFDAASFQFRFANKGALKNLGYTLEQLQSLTTLDVKPKFTLETYRQLIRPLFTGEKDILVFETDQQRADGSLYPVEVHLQLFDYPDYQVLLAAIQDITLRRETESVLRKSLAFLKETERLTGVGGWEWDVHSQVSTWSDEVYHIHGLDPHTTDLTSPEIIQRSLDCYHPDDRPNVQAAFETCITEGKAYDVEARFVSLSGEEKWVRTTGKADWENGQVVRITGSLMDITEQHRLRDNYQLLFSEMLEGFALHTILLDPQGNPQDYRFEAVNPAYERLTGLRASEIIGKTATQVLPDIEGHWINTYGKVALSGNPVFFEDYNQDLGRYYEITAFRPALNQFACIFIDTTRRKQAEAKLQEQLTELRRWHEVTLGRETRVIELKGEINQLLAETGRPPRYPSLQETAHE